MTPRASPARKAPDTYHHGDLREALIEAALDALERGGAGAVGFSALSRTLGVSQAAPYRHFADRDDLLTAVATRGFTASMAWLQAAADVEDGRSRLARIGHAYLAFGLEHAELYRLMYASRLLPRAAVDSDLFIAADAGFDVVLEAIDPSLEDLIRRRFALKFWTSLHGVATLAEQGLLPPKVRQISVAELIDELVHDTELAIATAAGRSRT
ncbi:MAG TPA: TetR/AcrR family transcriptional regulator [Caulobacteraceae bacterium]